MALMVIIGGSKQIWTNYCANIYVSDMDWMWWKDECIVLMADGWTDRCAHNDVWRDRLTARRMVLTGLVCDANARWPITTFYGRSNGFTDLTTVIAHGRYAHVDDGSMVQPRFLSRCAAERWGRRLTGTFMIFTVSSVSKSWKRWNTNDMPWHDGHSKKGSCVIVSCPLEMLKFQWKVDIGHGRHGNFL